MKRILLVFFCFGLANLGISMTPVGVNDPFSLIDTAKARVHIDSPDAVFLSIRAIKDFEAIGQCNKTAWEFVFTDHTNKQTVFLGIFEEDLGQSCELKSEVRVSKRYPWIGIKNFEDILKNKKFSYDDSIVALKKHLLDQSFELIDQSIYRTTHYKHSHKIVGYFLVSSNGKSQRLFFNYMSGEMSKE